MPLRLSAPAENIRRRADGNPRVTMNQTLPRPDRGDAPDHDRTGQPAALSIAGSDSGGGAGIQADLRAFAFFNVFGATVITAVTAQNPHAVRGVEALSADMIRAQYAAVTDAITVRAAKTGMLFSADIIDAVSQAYGAAPRFPLVIDPVMVATSGSRLLRQDAVDALRDRMLPLAAVITPNVPEAEILVGHALQSFDDLSRAARSLAARYDCMVVVKGGHRDRLIGVDAVSDGDGAWRLSAEPLAPETTHGTGCSLSAAVTACLARGDTRLDAAVKAKAYVYGMLRNCRRVGPESWASMNPPALPMDCVRCDAC